MPPKKPTAAAPKKSAGTATASAATQRASSATQQAQDTPQDDASDASVSDHEEDPDLDEEERQESKDPRKFKNPASFPAQRRLDLARRSMLPFCHRDYVSMDGVKIRGRGRQGRVLAAQKDMEVEVMLLTLEEHYKLTKCEGFRPEYLFLPLYVRGLVSFS